MHVKRLTHLLAAGLPALEPTTVARLGPSDRKPARCCLFIGNTSVMEHQGQRYDSLRNVFSMLSVQRATPSDRSRAS